MSITEASKSIKTPATSEEFLSIITSYQTEIDHLKGQIAQYRKMIFGQKTERFVPAVPEEQMTLEGLFEHANSKIPGFAESTQTVTYERRKPKKGHGRKPIPDDLHREKHILDVPESEKICSCCSSAKKHIGDDITEELEYKPAVFFVNQYVRPKYACAKCPDEGIATAPLVDRPIDKGIAGPGLLAYILISKFVDHLPLYRLEQMFKRYNIHINRSTMCGWMAHIAVYLEAVYLEMHRQLVADSFVVQADETTLKVMDETVPDKCALGYLWPFVGDEKLAVFEFRDSRSREGPTDFLSDFKERYLMSDGYAGYNQVITKNKLGHLMCWAHARRKFFENKALDPLFANKVLTLIQELYHVEREATGLNMTPPQRSELRKTKSAPILQSIKELLQNPGTTILPKNKLAEAVAYTLNHWAQLNRFLEDGKLPIDNNLVENIIRPIALGRKNWLFAGSPDGAKRLAIFYSIMATCKINNINPYEYLYDILPKIPSYPSSKIADLTPLNWKITRNSPLAKMG